MVCGCCPQNEFTQPIDTISFFPGALFCTFGGTLNLFGHSKLMKSSHLKMAFDVFLVAVANTIHVCWFYLKMRENTILPNGLGNFLSFNDSRIGDTMSMFYGFRD